jgi:hypothetical protein
VILIIVGAVGLLIGLFLAARGSLQGPPPPPGTL